MLDWPISRRLANTIGPVRKKQQQQLTNIHKVPDSTLSWILPSKAHYNATPCQPPWLGGCKSRTVA